MKKIDISISTLFSMTSPDNSYGGGTESFIFLLPEYNNAILFKCFIDNLYERAKNKENILTDFDKLDKENPLPAFFVKPIDLYFFNGKLNGYTMPYVNGTSFADYIFNQNVDFQTKKELLIKVGKLLCEMKEYRQKTQSKIYLNDFHEDNILVDNYNNLKLVDVDSLKINNNYVSQSLYLLKLDYLKNRLKYPREKINPIYGRQVMPSQNTEIYCYVIMILNTLLEDKITQFSFRQLKSYFDYLEYLGLSKDLLQALKSPFTKSETINPYEYLNDLKEMPETSLSNYKVRKKILR